jgi:PII-like signaling protein
MSNSEFSVLKIYASTTDRIGSKVFYDYIVYKARETGISGVTVYRGIMGYGLSSKIHSSKFWELTEKLPVTIEIIDKTEKLETFYQEVEEVLINMPKGCLVLMEPVKVRLHKRGNTID